MPNNKMISQLKTLMNMNVRLYVAALGTICLAACSNTDEVTQPQTDAPVSLSVTAAISQTAARAAGATFESDDQIGILPIKDGVIETAQANIGYTYGAEKFTPTATPYYFQSSHDVDFHAYYPYQAALPQDYAIAIDTRAGNQTEEEVYGHAWRKNDYLFASAMASKGKPQVSYTGDAAFRHVMSQVEFVFKAGTSDGVASLTSLTGYKIATPLAMDGTFSLTTGEATPDGSKGKEPIAMPIEGATGTELSCMPLLLLPQTIEGGQLALEVTYNGQTYAATLAAPANGLQPGEHYTYAVTIKNTKLEVGDASITPWGQPEGMEGDATLQ